MTSTTDDLENDLEQAITGCLLGTAVGDALGLCCRGLSKQRLDRLYPNLDGYHFLGSRGMVSDDTEHACMTAQALILAGSDDKRFVRQLGRQLRLWLLGVPAGVGLATLRSCLKLWLGFSPERSGVYSAGNGPAMRSPILGVCYGNNPLLLRRMVRASTCLTHTDPKAEHGALAVALAAHLTRTTPGPAVAPDHYLHALTELLAGEGEELLALITTAVESVAAGQSTERYTAALGLERGVSGYIYHTVPVVLHAWLSHPGDLRAGLPAVIRCGGDTDTTAAILGGILGAGLGEEGIPPSWRNGLFEWPRNVAWIKRLSARLASAISQEQPQPPMSVSLLAVLPRNLLFLMVVLAHGFRRLLPPY